MMYVNAGNAIAKSLEFDTQFPLKRFVEPAPNVDISLDLSKNWSRVTYRADPNDLTDYLKQHDADRILDPTIFSIKLGLDYKANDLPLSIGSNLRYVKAHSQLTSKTQRTLSSNSHEIDLYSSWKFNKQSQLRFSIDNILKRRFSNVSEDVTPMLRSLTTFKNPVFRRVALNYEYKF
jgi:outer membrane receptor for ferrienterochelin and colicins